MNRVIELLRDFGRVIKETQFESEVYKGFGSKFNKTGILNQRNRFLDNAIRI